VSVESGLPERVHHLIWDTFFVRAGRGVDFAAHLPWQADPAVRSVILEMPRGTVVGAATIRPALQGGVAMVGFVCVDAEVRGHGYGGQLIEAVNEAIDAGGYDAALLWTGKPDLYARHGYRTIDREHFLKITQLSNVAPSPEIRVVPWPDAGDRIGLPAFARSAVRLRSDRGEVILAHGARGVSVIDWRGTPADVIATMQASGHASWAVNVTDPESFLAVLPPDRFAVAIGAGAVTMVRRRDPGFCLDHVAVAERI